MADAQFTWARSLDTSSAPYSEQDYPFDPGLNYGPSDYNVGKAFKLFGMWQPVLFHGDNRWMERIAGGWSLSGIFNWHSGFPWTPTASVSNPNPLDPGGSLYCDNCGYTSLPAVYLGGAGTDTGNDQFKTGSNYSQGAAAYFVAPAYTAYTGVTTPPYGNANPQLAHRNTLIGPRYRDVDITLAKGFGLPNLPVLGENAKFEFRFDVYNLFNNLNFNPTTISNNISNSNFGQATTALAGRTATLGVRFSF